MIPGPEETMVKLKVHEPTVDAYLRDGCGRCAHFQTPECKVHRWTAALQALREIVLSTGLEETIKWGVPCYTHDDKNVAMVAAFKDHCALSLFEGAALVDDDGLLERPGPNSRIARFVRFASEADVRARGTALRHLLQQAIDHAREGKKLDLPPPDDPVPDELQRVLDGRPALQTAFAALTPGRRRSHILHVSGAKQTETRARRAERCAEDILAGRGFHER
jgi:uncharacterized protein YdeI (YjbR/CyaY-like superfamily)